MLRADEAVETAAVPIKSWQSLGAFLARDSLIVPSGAKISARKEWEEISQAERDLDDRLTVGLVGGTGVGKSTLINALAGEAISVSGDRRPTTDRVIAYRHHKTQLPEALPRSDVAEPEVVHQREALERVTILDFPDFDSVEEIHHQILERFLPHLDVLIVLVDDVKYGDLRLFELLKSLPQSHENLHAVINKVDRLERRYPGRWRSVASEILDDLALKLDLHAGIRVHRDRMLAISARNAFGVRSGASKEGAEVGDFDALVAFLENYRQEKRRRAAKELNIEARKAALCEKLRDVALDAKEEERIRRAAELLEKRRAELERTFAGISPAILRYEERRRIASLSLRRESSRCGFPVDSLLTLASELKLRKAPSATEEALLSDAGESQQGPFSAGRIKDHYRAYVDAVDNCLREIELLSITSVSAGFPKEKWAMTLVIPSLKRSRWRNHALPLLVLGLFLWSFAYPAVNGAVRRILGEEGATWGKVLKDLLLSLIESLQPSALAGMILLICISYAATAVLAWTRQVQRIERAVRRAEDGVRKRVHGEGQRALLEASERLKTWQAERTELEKLLGGARD